MTDHALQPGQSTAPTWHLAEEEDHDHGGNGATLLGFWIYLMSDALIFASLFAMYGVV
ncbi:MAG: cytochrome o ubiquinol oxidase subunit III, partial [Alphaproteobacteria bacterium]